MLEISLFYSFLLRLTKQFIISVKLSISEFLFFLFLLTDCLTHQYFNFSNDIIPGTFPAVFWETESSGESNSSWFQLSVSVDA